MNNANAQPVENKQGVSTQGQSANNVVKPTVSTSTAPQQVQAKPTIQQPTQQPQMRKKGESLSQSIRKLEDGRPYPSDYSTNSLKYILCR